MSDATSSRGAIESVLLVIGDELLAGEIADLNGPWLAEALASEGIHVVEMRVLPDDLGFISKALEAACDNTHLVILCGGLGPTSDDLTTEAVALALGVETSLDEGAWAAIQALFAARGMKLPLGNEKQAVFPAGAEVLPNAQGTAPGFLTTSRGGARVAVLPGPPRENRAMFTSELLPRLRSIFPSAPRWETRVLRVFGLPESTVGQRLRQVEAAHPSVRVGYQARFPEILVKLRYQSDAQSEIESAAAGVRAALTPFVYAEGSAPLPEVLGRRAMGLGLRLVAAESCTGGWVGKLLTDTPGSSAWFEEALVTYSNSAKVELLEVAPALLDEHGAVSEPVAAAMLRGALARSRGRAQVGVAITGVAGPEGGTEAKPVGTVCIAFGSAEELETRTHRFPFDRDRNRLLAAWSSLGHLLRWLDERPA